MKHSTSANDLILKPQVSWKLCFPPTAHWNGDGMGWSKRICFLMRQNVIHLNWDMGRKSNQCPSFGILTKSLSAWAGQKYTHTQNVPIGYKIHEEIIFNIHGMVILLKLYNVKWEKWQGSAFPFFNQLNFGGRGINMRNLCDHHRETFSVFPIV